MLPALVAMVIVILATGVLMRLVRQPFVIGFLAGPHVVAGTIPLQVVGGLGVLALFVWMIRKREIRMPLSRLLDNDSELKVFAALIPCLGLALITGLIGLSTGLGAFLGGILLAMTRETHWVSESLKLFESSSWGCSCCPWACSRIFRSWP